MKTDIPTAIAGIAIMSLITFGTRAFPFLVFRSHKPGPRFMAMQRRLPALILPILLAYALKDTPWTEVTEVIRTAVCLFLVIGLQVWKKNPLLSIFGGTGLYMAWKPILTLIGL